MQRLAIIKYVYALVTTDEGFSNLARLSGTSLTHASYVPTMDSRDGLRSVSVVIESVRLTLDP
jgi:hypothetical protein